MCGSAMFRLKQWPGVTKAGNLQPYTPTESQLMSSTVMNKMFGLDVFAWAEWIPETQKTLAKKERTRIRIVCSVMLPGRKS